MSDWKPISTAPKDGTWILVFEPYEGIEDSIQVARWGEVEWSSGEPEFDWVGEPAGPNPDTNTYTGASHWMPLPKPPC